MERIFVDSNYFIALYRANDSLHSKALEIARTFDNQEKAFVISNFIFNEVVTVLSQREGKEAGREIGDLLLQDKSIELVHIDESIQKKSWEMFRLMREKDVSLVDCSIIAVMNAESIISLLTFDVKDFKSLQKQYRISLYPLKT